MRRLHVEEVSRDRHVEEVSRVGSSSGYIEKTCGEGISISRKLVEEAYGFGTSRESVQEACGS